MFNQASRFKRILNRRLYALHRQFMRQFTYRLLKETGLGRQIRLFVAHTVTYSRNLRQIVVYYLNHERDFRRVEFEI